MIYHVRIRVVDADLIPQEVVLWTLIHLLLLSVSIQKASDLRGFIQEFTV